MSITPREEQMAALIKQDQGGPIHMLNLLKFRDYAAYADGSDADVSGKDAYMRYGAAVTQLVIDVGGEFLFASDANLLVIGEGDLKWDMVAIAKYPSVAAFIEMSSSKAYQDIHHHREAGLEHQLLIQC